MARNPITDSGAPGSHIHPGQPVASSPANSRTNGVHFRSDRPSLACLQFSRTPIVRPSHYIERVVTWFWSYDMVSRPRDLADRMAGRRHLADGYVRETYALPRDKARSKAREFLDRYPKAAYMSAVESWRELPDGRIEFTMKRLPSAD